MFVQKAALQIDPASACDERNRHEREQAMRDGDDEDRILAPRGRVASETR